MSLVVWMWFGCEYVSMRTCEWSDLLCESEKYVILIVQGTNKKKHKQIQKHMGLGMCWLDRGMSSHSIVTCQNQRPCGLCWYCISLCGRRTIYGWHVWRWLLIRRYKIETNILQDRFSLLGYRYRLIRYSSSNLYTIQRCWWNQIRYFGNG